MTDKTTLGDRMKQYEEAVGNQLLRRTPVIIRVDGKAFHTFTRRLTETVDPSVKFHFSERLHRVMLHTAGAMMMKTQNAVFAYTQSDEISFLLADWENLETQQWFAGKTQKIISISAAMASAYFNYFWDEEFSKPSSDAPVIDINGNIFEAAGGDHFTNLALFDARAFNVPREDVDNYFIWRQKDAIRNSINFIARKFISHKQLQNLNGEQIRNKLFAEHGVQWEEYPLWEQRGSCIVVNPDRFSSINPLIVDNDIPLFTLDREYILKTMTFQSEESV